MHPASDLILPHKAMLAGHGAADDLLTREGILGVFDEGCMGMYNAIIPDHLLNATGVFKERLSQSALWAAMRQVADEEAPEVRNWLDAKGMRFVTAPTRPTDLTDAQNSLAMPHVRCRSAHRGRVRLRCDRDPVPAGTEGHLPSLRSRGGPA